MDAQAIAAHIAGTAMATYTTRDERAALRCGLGDAAALCDALARDVAAENRGRGGKGTVTKLGLQLEAVAKRCGDAIWQMRDQVTVPQDHPPVLVERPPWMSLGSGYSDCERCHRRVHGPCSRDDCGKASVKSADPGPDQWRDVRRGTFGDCRQADGKCYAERSGNPGWCDRNGCLIGDGLDGCPNDD